MSSTIDRPSSHIAAFKCSDIGDCGRIFPVEVDEERCPTVGGFDIRCPACSARGFDTGFPIEHFQAKKPSHQKRRRRKR